MFAAFIETLEMFARATKTLSPEMLLCSNRRHDVSIWEDHPIGSCLRDIAALMHTIRDFGVGRKDVRRFYSAYIAESIKHVTNARHSQSFLVPPPSAVSGNPLSLGQAIMELTGRSSRK